jgi:hypothetical protein
LNSLESTYRTVKKSRRALRATGLTTKFQNVDFTLSPEQLSAYVKEMATLNDAQLDLERLVLELGHFPDSFRGSPDLSKTLGSMESYVRRVLTEFEEKLPTLRNNAGTTPFSSLAKLVDFTSSNRTSEFGSKFSDGHDKALGLIRVELLPLRVALGFKDKT